MAELTPERLIAQLGKSPLRPAYLIAGAETLRVLECADAIRTQARRDGIDEREVHDADARDFDWNALDAGFHAPSLFSARRLVELRLPSGKPGKDGAEVLQAFCARPPADVVLLVTCNEWSSKHAGKWSQAIAQCGDLAVAWPIKPHELPDWIGRRLHAKALRADHEAVMHLAHRVEGNLLAAAQEIDKLVLLDDGGTLDAAKMDALVTDAARFDVFRLLDAAMNGQPAQVSRILAGLRAEGEAVPGLLGMVGMELQRAARLAQAKARGGNLAAEFRANGVWESRQAAYRRALERHDAKRWERLLVALGGVDRTAKGRGEGDAWVLLERLLLAVADSRGMRLLARAA